MSLSEVKRETGAKPVRSRHCKQGVWFCMRKHDHWETGKIEAYVDWQVRKPACCLVREHRFQITSNWLYRFLYTTDLLPFSKGFFY